MAGGLTRWDPLAETRDGVVEVTIPLPRDSAKRRIEITPTAGSDGA